MSAITTIVGVMPLIKSAADTIAAFSGTDDQARESNAIQDAAEIIGAVAPLVDAFSRGVDVTPEDVREALIGMDQALASFDAEIARQGGDPAGGGTGIDPSAAGT